MLKAALVLVACVALTHGQGLAQVLKYVPSNILEKAEKMSDVVQSVIKEETPEKPEAKVPGFCNKLDCPPFTVKETTKEYELREYEQTNWVETALTGIDYKTAQYQMFMKLFNYISGNNAAKQKIAMTVPVIVRIIPGQGPACENNFTMAFYVSPKEGQPPAPSDPTVHLLTLPSIRAYATSFGGFSNQDKNIAHAKELGEALKKDKKAFEDTYFYTAGYDAPFKLFKRHNEVWFLAK